MRISMLEKFGHTRNALSSAAYNKHEVLIACDDKGTCTIAESPIFQRREDGSYDALKNGVVFTGLPAGQDEHNFYLSTTFGKCAYSKEAFNHLIGATKMKELENFFQGEYADHAMFEISGNVKTDFKQRCSVPITRGRTPSLCRGATLSRPFSGWGRSRLFSFACKEAGRIERENRGLWKR